MTASNTERLKWPNSRYSAAKYAAQRSLARGSGGSCLAGKGFSSRGSRGLRGLSGRASQLIPAGLLFPKWLNLVMHVSALIQISLINQCFSPAFAWRSLFSIYASPMDYAIPVDNDVGTMRGQRTEGVKFAIDRNHLKDAKRACSVVWCEKNKPSSDYITLSGAKWGILKME